ncbi:glycosyltransferase family 2 protein [Rhodoferax sp.]|uniref:glycosyltransferase family 2 protein n=1 Tax=Rhodoferax sp. TaxID=50421 RepID=UPI0025CDA143|nr:glycosyltransferase family 2 protein [Rhodoferax sp.]
MSSHLPVSIVVPCFRCAKTIKRAVASIAGQSMRPQEVILVDDGNDDDTPLVLQRLLAAYPAGWISVVTIAVNHGAATARNAGWAAAKGRYVAFLDADDTWHPEKLALQYNYMRARPALMLTGHGFIRADGDRVPWLPFTTEGVQGRTVKPWKVLLKNPFITPSIMVRADAPLRFPTGQRHMEDHFFLMQLALRGVSMSGIDRPLAAIHKHQYGQAGLSSNMNAMHRAELENLRKLQQAGDISQWTRYALGFYVKLKFIRRKFLVVLRKHTKTCR